MSFTCDVCRIPQPAGTKPRRVVTLWREKRYPVRFAKDGKTVIDNGGKGIEIAEEKNLCSKCLLPSVSE